MAIEARDAKGNLDTDWTVAQTNINGAITKISGTAPISVTGSGSSRAIALNDSGVAAGSYTKVTVDAKRKSNWRKQSDDVSRIWNYGCNLRVRSGGSDQH